MIYDGKRYSIYSCCLYVVVRRKYVNSSFRETSRFIDLKKNNVHQLTDDKPQALRQHVSWFALISHPIISHLFQFALSELTCCEGRAYLRLCHLNSGKILWFHSHVKKLCFLRAGTKTTISIITIVSPQMYNNRTAESNLLSCFHFFPGFSFGSSFGLLGHSPNISPGAWLEKLWRIVTYSPAPQGHFQENIWTSAHASKQHLFHNEPGPLYWPVFRGWADDLYFQWVGLWDSIRMRCIWAEIWVVAMESADGLGYSHLRSVTVASWGKRRKGVISLVFSFISSTILCLQFNPLPFQLRRLTFSSFLWQIEREIVPSVLHRGEF